MSCKHSASAIIKLNYNAANIGSTEVPRGRAITVGRYNGPIATHGSLVRSSRQSNIWTTTKGIGFICDATAVGKSMPSKFESSHGQIGAEIHG